MNVQKQQLKPQDIVVLLKIASLENSQWSQVLLADQLYISQSEISQSIARSKYARLLQPNGRQVMKLALTEFLLHGLAYVFPQHPGPIVRGVPTAHSAPPLVHQIKSTEHYVWPSAKGTVRGHSIAPLYPSVVDAVKVDTNLYELLAMLDALRVGRAREKEFASQEIKKRLEGG